MLRNGTPSENNAPNEYWNETGMERKRIKKRRHKQEENLNRIPIDYK